jgi:hypothetical protein
VAKVSDQIMAVLKNENRPLTIRELAISLYGEDSQHKLSQAMVSMRKVGAIEVVQNTKPMQFIPTIKDKKVAQTSTQNIPAKFKSAKIEIDLSSCDTSKDVREAARVALENSGLDLKALDAHCNSKFISSEYKSTPKVMIYPVEAAWALAYCMGRNRPYYPDNIKKLVREIKNGTWGFSNGQPNPGKPVVFNLSNRQKEGQHRFIAVLVTGEAISVTLNIGSTEADVVGELPEKDRKPLDQLFMSLCEAGYEDEVNEKDIELYRNVASRIESTPGSRITGSKFSGVGADEFAHCPEKVSEMFRLVKHQKRCWKAAAELPMRTVGNNGRVLVSGFVDMARENNVEAATKVYQVAFGSETATLGKTGTAARYVLDKLLGAKSLHREKREIAILRILLKLAKILAQPNVRSTDKNWGPRSAFFRDETAELNHPEL